MIDVFPLLCVVAVVLAVLHYGGDDE